MLKFGTSGLRGLVTELTDRECYLYTTAFLKYIFDKKLVRKNSSVAIAGDFRPSTEKILKSVIKAVKDFGLRPDYCGIIPTPTVSLYGFRRNFPSIMVTGSHIPYDRNGIKFNLPDGEILKKDEKEITKYYLKIAAGSAADSLFENNGSFKKSPAQLPKINPKAKSEYIERYLKFFPKNLLKGKKIVVYQHSSVARDIMVKIIKKLGAGVIPVGRSEKFIPIDTEAIQDIDLQRARAWSKKYKPEAIVSADGDGDRPIFFDETGSFIRGDFLDVICAVYLKADSVSATASCNTVLERCKKFKNINRTKIGSPYVVEAMYKDKKKGWKRILSYEANGGILTNSNFGLGGRNLSTLPTRDSLLPILGALALSVEHNLSVSKLLQMFPQRYVFSNSLKGFPTEISFEILNKISKNSSAAKKTAEKIFGLPSAVQHFDFIDGARMHLKNGEIIHVRPSANSPELRVYCETNDFQRSKELAEKTLEKISKLKD